MLEVLSSKRSLTTPSRSVVVCEAAGKMRSGPSILLLSSSAVIFIRDFRKREASFEVKFLTLEEPERRGEREGHHTSKGARARELTLQVYTVHQCRNPPPSPPSPSPSSPLPPQVGGRESRSGRAVAFTAASGGTTVHGELRPSEGGVRRYRRTRAFLDLLHQMYFLLGYCSGMLPIVVPWRALLSAHALCCRNSHGCCWAAFCSVLASGKPKAYPFFSLLPALGARPHDFGLQGFLLL